jgi:drug/metabolite transporter (DMT)-like permease
MSTALLSLSPTQGLGIPVALLGSIFLAAGAEFQQHGVARVRANTVGVHKPGLDLRQLFALAHRASWLIGTACLAVAILLQLFSLYLAPLTVVQPLGALALVVTALTTARITRTRLDRAQIRAIILCVGGVGVFVTVAAVTTTTVAIHNNQLTVVLIILGSVLAAFTTLYVAFRARLGRLAYVIGAGVLFGFVATLAKVLITRLQTIEQAGFHLVFSDWLTVVCLLGLVAAALLGTYFQQTAYASGSPEVVVAGLTVVDPLVGVTVGIVVLGEAQSAPLWATAIFIVAGAAAIYGVVLLARTKTPIGPAKALPSLPGPSALTIDDGVEEAGPRTHLKEGS